MAQLYQASITMGGGVWEGKRLMEVEGEGMNNKCNINQNSFLTPSNYMATLRVTI